MAIPETRNLSYQGANLPQVTEADDGKVLGVVGGKWVVKDDESGGTSSYVKISLTEGQIEALSTALNQTSARVPISQGFTVGGALTAEQREILNAAIQSNQMVYVDSGISLGGALATQLTHDNLSFRLFFPIFTTSGGTAFDVSLFDYEDETGERVSAVSVIRYTPMGD